MTFDTKLFYPDLIRSKEVVIVDYFDINTDGNGIEMIALPTLDRLMLKMSIIFYNFPLPFQNECQVGACRCQNWSHLYTSFLKRYFSIFKLSNLWLFCEINVCTAVEQRKYDFYCAVLLPLIMW